MGAGLPSVSRGLDSPGPSCGVRLLDGSPGSGLRTLDTVLEDSPGDALVTGALSVICYWQIVSQTALADPQEGASCQTAHLPRALGAS